MDRKFTFAVIFIVFIYLFLRFIYPETIQLGYDQPRLATTIQDFIEHGSYLTSQEYSLKSPWGNLSWGPALIFFYSIFLRISGNPIVISLFVAVFNLLSVLIVIYIGWKFFSPKVGLVAGLTLAVHPWWVIFSRMFYQPSVIPTLVAISMLLFFYALKHPEKYFLSFLIFSWGVLVQFYLITISFIVTSAAFLTITLKKLSWIMVLLGLLLLGLIFVPTINFYAANDAALKSFLSAPGRFESTTRDVIQNFVGVISGGKFEWELGYGYKDFVKQNPATPLIFKICLILMGIVLLHSFASIFTTKKRRYERILLLMWLIAPVWFLSFVKVEYVVPRYFLMSLPAFSLLFGVFIEDVGRLFLIILPLWAYSLISYYSFLVSYNYSQGFLSHFSDPPYVFMQKSFDWIVQDAKTKGYEYLNIDTDANWSVNYLFNYVYNLDEMKGNKIGYYELRFKSTDFIGKFDLQEFGPYVVYESAGI